MASTLIAPAPAASAAVPLEAPQPAPRHAPPAPTLVPRPRRYYRPELDVLRCLAFFLVFSSHVLPFPHSPAAWTALSAVQEGVSGGVPLFFILTSFLITELLLRESDATGTVHIKAFYLRRILRIWPLYFLALAGAFLLPHLVHSFDPIGACLAPFLLLSGNWAILHHGWFHNPMLTPLWSTPVQEQFYLLWPLLFVWWGRRGLVAAVAVLLPVAWFLDYHLPAAHLTRSPALWCNSFNQFQFFALGSALALILHHRPVHFTTPVRFALFATGAAAFFVSGTPCHFINDFMPSTPALTLAGYLALDAGCLLLCLAFLGATMPRAARPFIYLGKVSFGLYIFHYTVLSVVAAAVKAKLHTGPGLQLAVTYGVTAVLALALASLSYHYFETPFLRLKSRFTFVRSRPT
ncbi:acyltransferase [Acidipila sp. EB88]|uniref:acyltransferase family protein n=1 Tax=Acidipila sp. EB88 TaxID=2305226 RepID=UPI0013158C4E|nr:acyltransferase [Acidipila sp. EB88]